MELLALALEPLASARVAGRPEAAHPVAQLPEAVVFDPSSRSSLLLLQAHQGEADRRGGFLPPSWSI